MKIIEVIIDESTTIRSRAVQDGLTEDILIAAVSGHATHLKIPLGTGYAIIGKDLLPKCVIVVEEA